jgi:DNA-binding winged helix-turn-helix (wHTH) protein/tetratricopeptide (TPR) repeat protein
MEEERQLLQFGAFEVDPQSGELRKNGRKLKVQEQPFQILVALLQQPGELVTREDLRARLWPGDTFVDFDNGLNIAIRKLRQALGDDAEKPRYVETLPRRGYRFIGPVERPAQRESSTPASDRVVSITQGLDLQGGSPGRREAGATAHGGAAVPHLAESMSPPRPSPVPVAPPRRLEPSGLRMRYAIGLCLLLVAGGMVYLRLNSLEPRSPAGRKAMVDALPLQPRKSVAMLGFKNLSARPDAAWVSTALSEMFSAELAAGEQLRTVPGENVTRARIDMSLPDSDSYAPDTLSRIRRTLGADYVVVGSYFVTGQHPGARVRLDLRLQDTASGATLATLSEAGTEDDLDDLVSSLGARLRQKLGLGVVSAQDAGSVRAVQPSAEEAAQLYAEGLAKLRMFDAQGARDLLEQAVAIDPNYALAHAALAEAWSRLGYGELAKQEAKKALDLSGQLPRADRLSIEAGYRESTSEWEKAVEICSTLFSFFPDNADYGLRLAANQVKAGKGKEALATVEALRKIPAPAGADPAIDLMESTAADQLGDFRQAESAASTAGDRAQAGGARLLVADARARECQELPLLGRFDDARTACESAREIYAHAGDRSGAAASMGFLASVLANQGQPAAARQMYEQALTVDDEIGNQSGALWQLYGLANFAWTGGDYSGARARYQQALDVARKIGSRPDAADAMENIAFMELLEGKLVQAHSQFQSAIEEYRALANRGGVAGALNNLGATLYFQGDLAGASKALDEALTTDRETGNKPESADILAWSGRVRMAQGDLDNARRNYDEALAVWNEMGAKNYAATCGLRLAELDIETGRARDSEEPIRRSLGVSAQEQRVSVQIEGHSLLARALLQEGDATAARREIALALPLVAHTQSQAARLGFSIAAAQARAASGNESDLLAAERDLESALAAADRAGFLGYELELRLALGEIEMKAGRPAGIARLTALERDAQARGYLWIARKAATARSEAGKTNLRASTGA